jgi:hypothetical protein
MHTLHSIPFIASTTYTIGYANQQPDPASKSRLSKKGKEHDAIEHWLGLHNRKFEIMRTLTGVVSATTSSIVLLKVFGVF